MNIMFLFYRPIIPSKGGVQRVTHRLTCELLKRGHKVVFVSNTDKEDIDKYDFIAPQYHLELYGKNNNEIKSEIWSIVKQHNITHAICQTLDSATLFKYIPEEIKKIAVCHAQPFSTMSISRKRIWNTNTHNLRQKLFKLVSLILPLIHKNYFYKFEKRELEISNKYADKICFISERFFERIKKYMPSMPQDKFVAINNPNTYDISEIKYLGEKENIILWLGRVENPTKNAIDFVYMWKHLSPKAKNWRAIMVGDGCDLAYIKELARKEKVERLEFTGERIDAETFYRKSKYIAVTSYSESWCMVLVEAMSYGCVPIAYDTYETLHDIVDDKKNGFIIPQISYKMMAECLEKSINNKEEYRIMSTEAKEKVKRFSIELTVNKWEELLNNI